MLPLALPAPAEQQVDHAGQQGNGHNGADAEGRLTGEQPAELEYDEGHNIGKDAHIADGGRRRGHRAG